METVWNQAEVRAAQERGAALLSTADLSGLTIETRPYQQRIVQKTLGYMSWEPSPGSPARPIHSVMIESPTGSGKTVMGLLAARVLQRKYGYRVGWVAMRRNLLSQAARENAARGFGVELQTISMFDKQPPGVDLLIVDEAQHDAAMSMANLHCRIRPRKVIGLTATPYRTDRIKLCFDKVICDAGIHQLIQDGHLSPYDHYTIPEYTPDAVAEHYLRDASRWGKTLIFFHRLPQCLACHARLRDAGVRVEVVTARSDRERQLAAFQRGELQVLINMAILTEGFDCPQLKTVFCRPSGKSCTVQMGGRVFRKHPELPRKQIVQCAQTRHPFSKTARAQVQYVWNEGEWRSLQVNPRIEGIARQSRRLIADAVVTLPKLVAANRRRGAGWWQDREE